MSEFQKRIDDFIDTLIKLSYTDIQSDNMEYNFFNTSRGLSMCSKE